MQSLLHKFEDGGWAELRRYGSAVGLAILALLLRVLFAPLIGDVGSPFLFFSSAVAISALLGGLRSGLVTLGLAGVFIAYFLLPPLRSLSVAAFSDVIQLGVFSGEGLVVTLIGKALRMAWRQADQARADFAQAVSIRDQFLSVAAHELRSPLTLLVGYTQTLQRRAARTGNLSARDQRAVQVISDEARRLNDLIESLLDISRVQVVHPHFPWCRFVSGLQEATRLNRHIRITVQITESAGEPCKWAD